MNIYAMLLFLYVGKTPEYYIFKKQYDTLIDTLKQTDLYRYFVSEDIITISDHEEISSESIPTKKIEIFLMKISFPLEAGHTESFYRMLTVMTTRGNLAVKELAESIKESVKSHYGNIIICMSLLYTKAKYYSWYIAIIANWLKLYYE